MFVKIPISVSSRTVLHHLTWVAQPKTSRPSWISNLQVAIDLRDQKKHRICKYKGYRYKIRWQRRCLFNYEGEHWTPRGQQMEKSSKHTFVWLKKVNKKKSSIKSKGRKIKQQAQSYSHRIPHADLQNNLKNKLSLTNMARKSRNHSMAIKAEQPPLNSPLSWFSLQKHLALEKQTSWWDWTPCERMGPGLTGGPCKS